MINIRSVSDLRNYTDALKDIAPGSPVFLTKNGRGKYVVMLIDDYEKLIGSARPAAEPAVEQAQPEATVSEPAQEIAEPAPVEEVVSLSVDDVLSALGVE